MSEADRLYQEGCSLVAKGDYNRAISVLSDAIRLNPKNPDFYMKRGDAYLEIGEFY